MMAVIISAEVILLARVYAVYNRNKNVVYGAASIFLFTVTATVVAWWSYLPVGLALPPVADLTGCYTPTRSKNLGLSIIPALVHEVILCFCMLYKAWLTYKYEYGSPLLRLLIQDSLLYFSSILAVLLTICLIMFLSPPGLLEFGLGWGFAIPCAMGSRLLLRMFGQDIPTLPGSQNTGQL
ncbi:hypothetical protein JB92DRAFT_2226351 [Gautieria morchelliformis]|nr:hypothetical protein JB92DRAFT_2226351 [Gautieria morchelliformis]